MEEYATLPLGGKAQGLHVKLDPEDYERVKHWAWQLHQGGYAMRIASAGRSRSRMVLLHRFILDAPKDFEVDHINGDKLDNRRSNLRLATRSENMRNRPKSSRSSSPYKGVRLANGGPRWRAYIGSKADGQKHLGCFDSAEEAARAYDEAARELWGEYARVNFPE